jgi:hypothetical protein
MARTGAIRTHVALRSCEGVSLPISKSLRPLRPAPSLCQPIEPELAGHGFHVAWPQTHDADAGIAAVRAWLLQEANPRSSQATT